MIFLERQFTKKIKLSTHSKSEEALFEIAKLLIRLWIKLFDFDIQNRDRCLPVTLTSLGSFP